jgi:hypothetical protein
MSDGKPVPTPDLVRGMLFLTLLYATVAGQLGRELGVRFAGGSE